MKYQRFTEHFEEQGYDAGIAAGKAAAAASAESQGLPDGLTLEDASALLQPGAKDGAVKVIRENGAGVAYSWSSARYDQRPCAISTVSMCIQMCDIFVHVYYVKSIQHVRIHGVTGEHSNRQPMRRRMCCARRRLQANFYHGFDIRRQP